MIMMPKSDDESRKMCEGKKMESEKIIKGKNNRKDGKEEGEKEEEYIREANFRKKKRL